jgi:bifunctional pyridoxal-dependent enzyme with beta-cystathionase and maltose regulon repressor activities
MIIINTPHNPVGKVFTRQELEKIAVIAEEHNLLVMADEVVRITQICFRLFPMTSSNSMTVSCSMTMNTFDLLRCPVCGIVQ